MLNTWKPTLHYLVIFVAFSICHVTVTFYCQLLGNVACEWHEYCF